MNDETGVLLEIPVLVSGTHEQMRFVLIACRRKSAIVPNTIPAFPTIRTIPFQRVSRDLSLPNAR